MDSIKLTDRYGGDVYVLKESVLMLFADSVFEGDGQRGLTLWGTRLNFTSGGTSFVTEPVERVWNMLNGSVDDAGD